MVNQLEDLISQIKSAQSTRRKAEDPISFTVAERSSSGIDGGFLHSQLLLEYMVRVSLTQEENEELLKLCRTNYEDNQDELKYVNKFEHEYKSNKALWW